MQLPAGLAHTNLPGSGEKTQTMPEKQVITGHGRALLEV